MSQPGSKRACRKRMRALEPSDKGCVSEAVSGKAVGRSTGWYWERASAHSSQGAGRSRSRLGAGSWRRTLAFAPPSRILASDACVRAPESIRGVGRLRSRLGVGAWRRTLAFAPRSRPYGVGRLRSRLGGGSWRRTLAFAPWGRPYGVGRLRSRLALGLLRPTLRSRLRVVSWPRTLALAPRSPVGSWGRTLAFAPRVRRLALAPPRSRRHGVGRSRSRFAVVSSCRALALASPSRRRTLAIAPRSGLWASDACVRASQSALGDGRLRSRLASNLWRLRNASARAGPLEVWPPPSCSLLCFVAFAALTCYGRSERVALCCTFFSHAVVGAPTFQPPCCADGSENKHF